MFHLFLSILIGIKISTNQSALKLKNCKFTLKFCSAPSWVKTVSQLVQLIMELLKIFLYYILLRKLGHSRPIYFSSFLYSLFITVDSKWNCRWLDSNRGSLMSEATALPTAPQPLPNYLLLIIFQTTNFIVHQVQCDQIGYFLNDLETYSRTKLAQILGNFVLYLKNMSIYIKKLFWLLFWQSWWKLGYF